MNIVRIVSIVFMLTFTSFSFGDDKAPKFPELPGFEFFENAKWRPLLSSSTKAVNVLDLMGVPKKDITLNLSDKRGEEEDYVVRYITFDQDPNWKVTFRFVLVDSNKKEMETLRAIRISPKKPVDFSGMKFPSVFKKGESGGASFFGFLYYEPNGLSYEVTVTETEETHWPPGSLIGIEYRQIHGASR